MTEKNNRLELMITPDTRIGALLDAFPELESVLVEMAPAFKKLRNPVLRKTVAKVATLRQVAEIGDVSLGEMINRLRCTVGQDGIGNITENRHTDSHNMPQWISDDFISESLDARPMLARGEHPLQLVMSHIALLKGNEVFRLVTSFKPLPLIETAEKKGFRTWTRKNSEQEYFTYFGRSEDSQ